MKQLSLAQGGFEKYPKASRRAAFLAEMDRVVPWQELCKLIEPHYPKAVRGRPPVGLERMLRLHFLQHWYNLSDPGLEEALLESECRRRSKSEPPCRPNIEPGAKASLLMAGCG